MLAFPFWGLTDSDFFYHHLSRIDLPTIINWNSPFLFKGMLGGIFHIYSHFNRTLCKQTVETLIRSCILCCAASGLCLHYLPMSHKKDARLKWVNVYIYDLVLEPPHEISNKVAF